jgi:predicted ATPase
MMRIVSLSIEGFKSIGKLTLPEDGELGQLCCLIGANGAGKTTLLQALDLMSAMFDAGRIRDWLKDRGWDNAELGTAGQSKTLIHFSLTVKDDEDTFVWSAKFNRSKSIWRCTSEMLSVNDDSSFYVDNHYYMNFNKDGRSFKVGAGFDYFGSVFSTISTKISVFEPYGDKVSRFVNFMRGIKSLELLAPHLIRERAREGEALGPGGERLSLYLHKLEDSKKSELLSAFQRFYPQVVALKTGSLRGGWKRLLIVEDRAGARVEIDARHASDGMLRVLTILAELLCSPHPVVLFDEIENGLYPELLEPLIKLLGEAGKQVFVTTHSPLILNWMQPEIAQRDVFFVFRDAKHQLAARRFASLPSVREALTMLGPGEVFADMSLMRLEQDARAALVQPS